MGSFQSCENDINLAPEGFVPYAEMYNTKDQINLALNGIYNALGSQGMYGGNLFIFTAMGNDESWFRGSTSSNGTVGVFFYNYNSSDYYVTTLWNSCYIGIDRTNSLLAAMETSPADSVVKVSAIAQAKFIRACIYFNLVDNFGGVPLRLKPAESFAESSIARSTVQEVYNQILKDLTEAEAILPVITDLGSTGTGRPSKSAAQALLAKVCLTMAGQPLNDATKYQAAKKWASKVMDSKLHSLNPDFKKVFINQCQDKYDPKECIWEIEFTINPTGATTANFSLMGYNNGISCSDIDTGYVSQKIGPTKKLWDTYNDFNDKRRDWSIAPYVFKTTTTVPAITTRTYYTSTQIWDRYPGKWRREYETTKPKVKFQTGINVPVIRYADVLLMFAEAENELNGITDSAFMAVNLVRTRAGAYTFSSTNITSPEQFRSMIRDERMRELCFEGVRTHDLKRWGILIPTMKALANDISINAPTSYKIIPAVAGNNISEKDVVFAIPQSEMTNNRLMIQNVGF